MLWQEHIYKLHVLDNAYYDSRQQYQPETPLSSSLSRFRLSEDVNLNLDKNDCNSRA